MSLKSCFDDLFFSKTDKFDIKRVVQLLKLTLNLFILPWHWKVTTCFITQNIEDSPRFPNRVLLLYLTTSRACKWKLRLTKWDVRSPEEYLNAAASPAQRETRATHCGTCSKTQWRQCGREESHYPQHLHSHQSIVLFVASLWTVCLQERNKGRWTPSSTLEIRPLIPGYWCRTWPCNRGESSPGHTGLLLVHEKYMRRSRKLEGVPRPKWKSSAHSSHCVCVRESEFAHGCVVCGWVHVHQMSHIFYEPAVLAI